MSEVFSGNKGEWSEPYVLLKLLSDGKLYLGDGNLNKLENLMLPIISILREEQDGTRKYSYSDDKARVVFDFGAAGELLAVPLDEFEKHARLLLSAIKENRASSFTVPDVEEFLREIGCTRLSARSLSKSDIHIVVHDVRMGICPTLGFSIKSELGSKATLLNASGATKLLYEVQDCDNRIADEFNSLFNSRGKKDFRRRMALLERKGCSLAFQKADHRVFANNLILIDSRLPEILAEMLCQYYSGNAVATSDLSAQVCSKNPNDYDYSNNHHFYEYKVKRLLCEAALGMRPAEIWHGKYDATGGYLVVRQDGEIVCYHLYSHNQFEDYLFLNTKFETPSSSRHHFGDIYEQNGRFLLKLNLQIRFS